MEKTESFTAKDVMTLRQKTGLGMMDCKKALAETGGDPVAAEEWLRAQRKGKMDTRTERATGEGRIDVAVEGDQGAIVEVRTETDFTARNEQFVETVREIAQAAVKHQPGAITPDEQMTRHIDELRITTGENVNFARGEKLQGGSFGSYVHHDGKRAVLLQVEGSADDQLLKGICQHIVALDPKGITEQDIPADVLARVRSDALAEATETGKPKEIAEKIAEGKVRKFLEENALVHQKYVLDEKKTVKEVLPADLAIKRFVRYTLGG